MDISINRLQERDAEELFKFETDNRLFFEEMTPGRGDEYFKFETFKVRYRGLLAEQQDGKSKFYLIKDRSGDIVGRINLIDIDIINNVAEVGYRVGKDYLGKGIGTEALNQLLKTELNIKKIKGKTTNNNIASQRVLEKSGFSQVCISDEVFEMNGQKLKFVYYVLER